MNRDEKIFKAITDLVSENVTEEEILKILSPMLEEAREEKLSKARDTLAATASDYFSLLLGATCDVNETRLLLLEIEKELDEHFGPLKQPKKATKEKRKKECKCGKGGSKPNTIDIDLDEIAKWLKREGF